MWADLLLGCWKLNQSPHRNMAKFTVWQCPSKFACRCDSTCGGGSLKFIGVNHHHACVSTVHVSFLGQLGLRIVLWEARTRQPTSEWIDRQIGPQRVESTERENQWYIQRLERSAGS